MEACWANTLGNCSQTISGEHIVSKNLFEGESVNVIGFPWCKDEVKEIGLNSFTAKILCTKHNSDLEKVDTGGGDAFRVFREFRRLANVRNNIRSQRWNVVRYKIDGLLLERWFLKTLINLSFKGDYPIGNASMKGIPSKELVEIVYGLRSFSGRAGLYSVVRNGDDIYSVDQVAFSPLLKDKARIEGGLFVYRGLKFLLFFNPEGPPDPLTGIGFPGDDWGSAFLNYHNIRIDHREGKYMSQVIEITW